MSSKYAHILMFTFYPKRDNKYLTGSEMTVSHQDIPEDWVDDCPKDLLNWLKEIRRVIGTNTHLALYNRNTKKIVIRKYEDLVNEGDVEEMIHDVQ